MERFANSWMQVQNSIMRKKKQMNSAINTKSICNVCNKKNTIRNIRRQNMQNDPNYNIPGNAVFAVSMNN